VILLAITAGLYISGSPATRRKEALDQQRVENIIQISYAVDAFGKTYGRTPASLTELLQSQPQILNETRDPATGLEYEYRTPSSTSQFYELCATFDLETLPDDPVLAPAPLVSTSGTPLTFPSWYHMAGKDCFMINIRTASNTSGVVPRALPNYD
jgi:hypothetical protein